MSKTFVRGQDFAGFWHSGYLIGIEDNVAQIYEKIKDYNIIVYVTTETLKVIEDNEVNDGRLD